MCLVLIVFQYKYFIILYRFLCYHHDTKKTSNAKTSPSNIRGQTSLFSFAQETSSMMMRFFLPNLLRIKVIDTKGTPVKVLTIYSQYNRQGKY